jgi:hypothetical protein
MKDSWFEQMRIINHKLQTSSLVTSVSQRLYGADKSPSYTMPTVDPQQSLNDTNELIICSLGLQPALWHVVLCGARQHS